MVRSDAMTGPGIRIWIRARIRGGFWGRVRVRVTMDASVSVWVSDTIGTGMKRICSS